ncbi:pyrin-like [Pagrus major]|uniref:pyrin-like n=1 Tax=Pagrus major TaxID=143350 RepID=UPI003CC8D697
MLVPQLLLETLEEMRDEDFETLKWYLSMKILDGCNPIRKAHLQNTSRVQTVSKMIDSYGEESAVNVTVEILRTMNFNGPAEELKSRYAAVKTATPSSSSSSSSPSSAVAPPAAHAAMVAQHGSVIIAPNITSGTTGALNITINK